MAKFTDPNTGVKYSTHTGLKVFATIVSILLVISIVLNVVLYMQGSNDSELETGESEEGYDGDGEDGEDRDGENPSEILPEDEDKDSSDEETPVLDPNDYIDTETVVENENTEATTEFDENGVAECLYFYDDCGQSGCEDGCVGHKSYLTTGGGVYDTYPVLYTQALVGEDGSMDINSEIRVSVVSLYPEYEEMSVEEFREYCFEDFYFTCSADCIEIASLTGEPLEIESVDIREHIYYMSVSSGFTTTYYEYHSAEGLEVDFAAPYGYESDTTLVYDVHYSSYDGCYTVTLNMKDGNSYSFEYWKIGLNPSRKIGSEIVYVD